MTNRYSPPAIGIDIVEISRMAQALARRPKLYARLFTPAERCYCDGKRNAAQHYAVRFAAKEAVAKALGRSLSWQEVEITRGTTGPPQALLHGAAATTAAGGKIQISLSHSDGYAVACALFTPQSE